MELERIKELMELVARKGKIVEALERLKKMEGQAWDEEGTAKCKFIQFDSDYTASFSWNSGRDAGELNMLLVEAAINHLQKRLDEIERLLEEAEKVLQDFVGYELEQREPAEEKEDAGDAGDAYKIIRQWSNVERWSAHDTDEMFYVLIEYQGREHEFSALKEWTPERIRESLKTHLQSKEEQSKKAIVEEEAEMYIEILERWKAEDGAENTEEHPYFVRFRHAGKSYVLNTPMQASMKQIKDYVRKVLSEQTKQ